MFSLNPSGIFALPMFKTSYFPEWGNPLQTANTNVSLNTQYPLKKDMLFRYRLLRLQTTYRTVMNTSINFDVCNLSSSGDVVYKERW